MSRFIDPAVSRPAGVTLAYSGKIVDEFGAAIGSARMTTLVMTLYEDVALYPIVHARDHVSELNTDIGTLDVNGNLVIELTAADMVLLGAGPTENHVMLLEWTYDTGSKAGNHEVQFTVATIHRL